MHLLHAKVHNWQIKHDSHLVYSTYPELHHLAGGCSHDTLGTVQYQYTLMTGADFPGTLHSRSVDIVGSEDFCRNSCREDK